MPVLYATLPTYAMGDARTVPPSEQRLAEARRLGHVPRAPLPAVLAPWLACVAGLWAIRERLGHGVQALLRSAVERASAQAPQAWQPVWSVARDEVLVPLALVIGASWLVLALTTLVTQGPVFSLGSRVRARFAPLTIDRTASVLFVLGLVLVSVHALRGALRARSDTLADVLVSWALWSAAWLFACALVDVAFARARHLRSLWMTRREQRDEQREAYGSPELRAMRARMRREHDAGSTP